MTEQKQIEEMAEAIFKNCHCGLFFSEAEKIADFVINQQGYRKQSEWISVEERLPDIDGKYLVYTSKDFISTQYYYCTNAFGFETWDVTHWMPLPMPPKGDEGK